MCGRYYDDPSPLLVSTIERAQHSRTPHMANHRNSGFNKRNAGRGGVRPLAGRIVPVEPPASPSNPVVPTEPASPPKPVEVKAQDDRRSGSKDRRESAGRRSQDPRAVVTPPPVLVATADPSLSRMLAFAMDQMRYEYKELKTGPQTLSELTNMEVGQRPPVVVLDVDLPGMDGHAILERIALLRPNTFLILVISAHADESMQVRSLLGGAIDHMSKPFNVRILMAKVDRWVAMSARLGSL